MSKNTFTLYGNTITFDERDLFPNLMKVKYKNLATKFLEEFQTKYKEWGSIEGVLRNAESEVLNYADYIAKETVDELIKLGVYTVSEATLLEDYIDFSTFYESFDEVEAKYESIIEDAAERDAYRTQRRQSRGRVIGGGFGLQGAVKGIAAAGAVNLATGLVHGTFNVIGSMFSSSSDNNKKRQLYTNKEIVKSLAYGIVVDVNMFSETFIEIINQETGSSYKPGLSATEIRRIEGILDNFERISNEEHKTKAICDLIKLDPTDPSTYVKAFEHFGDVNGELEDIAYFFGIDLDIYKSSYAHECISDYILETDNDIPKFQQVVKNVIYNLGIQEEDAEYIWNLANEKIENQRCKDFNYVLEKQYKSLTFSKNDSFEKIVQNLFLQVSPTSKEFLSNPTFKASIFDKGLLPFKQNLSTQEQPLVYIENGILGSSGMLITNQNLLYKEMYGQVKSIPLFTLKQVEFIGKKIRMNDYIEIEDVIPSYHHQDAAEEFFISLLSVIKFSNTFEVKEDPFDISQIVHNEIAKIDEVELKKKICFPNTHPKQFANALNEYAHMEKDEIPLFFFDDTIFANGKKGSVITNKAIYINDGKMAFKIPHNKIQDMSINYVNNIPVKILIHTNNSTIDLITSPIGYDTEKQRLIDLLELIIEKSTSFSSQPSKQGMEGLALTEEHVVAEYFEQDEEDYAEQANDERDNSVKNYRESILYAFADGEVNYNGKFYYYNNIKKDSKTAKKFMNVLSSYAKIQDNEQPIVLFDNTGFGSAKDGFLLTDTAIYWHNMLETSKYVNYKDIHSVESSKKSLLINGEEIKLDMLDKKMAELLTNALEAIFLK
ncbi:hypothetical protein ACERII_18675 [Evansella sp. AB-rgal1]|uniref:hypothetical protein n=1 Tax=Evansella sp. AB-rgal1 TaxID=3242696 RepID=UPI00359DCAFC